MKSIKFIVVLPILLLYGCNTAPVINRDYSSVSQVEEGIPFSVMLTSYSTTLLANNFDKTDIRIAVTDSTGREISTATNAIQIYVTGEGSLTLPDGNRLESERDSTGTDFYICQLENGVCYLTYQVSDKTGKVKIEARSGSLWPGAHELHLIPGNFVLMEPAPDQLPPATKKIDRMIGADISFLPQIESSGRNFYCDGEVTDAVELMAQNGFNYIRLRIFVNPENEDGYSPGVGYCGLEHTLEMAKRIKNAGMNLLLDFHYSDYWADPQQQFKPEAWANLDYPDLRDSVKIYTARVLRLLVEQETPPSMVQIGNEINHGLLWPDGHISNPDKLAGLLIAGVEGAESVLPEMPVMMHIALGGQNKESVFWLDNMIARGVRFDIIGISYYPRWHGTLNDLRSNLEDLTLRYNKPINVVEYSDFKEYVHEIVFGLPDHMGKGTAIWEPLGPRSGMFDKDGNTTALLSIYKEMKIKYLD